MGNARKHMETKDLVNKIDQLPDELNNLQQNDLVLLKNASLKKWQSFANKISWSPKRKSLLNIDTSVKDNTKDEDSVSNVTPS